MLARAPHLLPLCIAALIVGSAARADGKAQTNSEPKAAPAADSTKAKPATSVRARRNPLLGRSRGASIGLASTKKRTTIAPRGTRTLAVRKEEAVKPISRFDVKQPVRKKTPFDEAINSLSTTLRLKLPRKAGRVRISFTVGKRGEVKNAFIVSYAPKLDKALEKQLSSYKFDPAYAGAVVSRTIMVKGKKASKKRRKRTARR